MAKNGYTLTDEELLEIKELAEYAEYKRGLQEIVHGKDGIDYTKLANKPRNEGEREQLLEWAGSDIQERYKITGLLIEDLGIAQTEVYGDDFKR